MPNLKRVILITGNKEKFNEMKMIFGPGLKRLNLDLPEIQALSVKTVVKHKAKQAYELIKKPLIVEDTGFYIKAWGGFPGALSKWLGRTMGYQNLSHLIKGSRKAFAETVIGYFNGKTYKDFIGRIEGTISKKPAGRKGFGWDIVFIPKGGKKTFAQMSPEEKNKISMRFRAVKKLKKYLQGKNYEKK